jgi:hypothetical protein
MKKFLSFGLLLLCLYAANAQTIPFQGVARDSNGILIPNHVISIRLSILDVTSTGTVVYKETDSVTTNNLGLFTLSIGSGTVVSGSFSGITWGSAPKFVKLEVDPTGGTSYINMGTSQLQSVPYALYSLNSGGLSIPSNQIPYGTGTGTTGDALFSRNPANYATQISRTVAGGINEGFTLGSAISGYVPDGPFFTRIDTPESHYDYMGIGNVSALTGGAPNGIVMICVHSLTGGGPLASVAIIDSDPVNTTVGISSQNNTVTKLQGKCNV